MRVEAHVHIGKARGGDVNCISYRPIPAGRVDYVSTLWLKNVKFAVQPAGLRKFRESGQKNVHAFIRGETLQRQQGEFAPPVPAGFRKALYNPVRNDTFVNDQGEPVYSASEAMLIGKNLYYKE